METHVNDNDDYEISSVDDQRKIGIGGMLLAAALFVLALMAVVYSPLMWGLSAFGSDLHK